MEQIKEILIINIKILFGKIILQSVIIIGLIISCIISEKLFDFGIEIEQMLFLLPIIGIILLTQIFDLFKEKSIVSLLLIRGYSIINIYIVNTIFAIIVIVTKIGFSLLLYNHFLLKIKLPIFNINLVINSLFLGMLGLIVALLSRNQTLGLLITFAYFVISYFVGSHFKIIYNCFILNSYEHLAIIALVISLMWIVGLINLKKIHF